MVSDAGGDTVSDKPMTPELALAYLGELSTDIRGAVLLDKQGSVAARSGFDEDDDEQLEELVGDLFAHAATATSAAGEPDANQVEIALPEGSVYALREHGWTLAVVTGRFALSSLMFFDLRMVIRDLAGVQRGAAS